MAEHLSGFPFFPVEFTKDGKLFHAAEQDAVLGAVEQDQFDELVLLSHGWNNDKADARALYKALLGSMRSLIDEGAVLSMQERRIGAIGIFWPSKKFAEHDLIPGGGASLGGDGDVPESALVQQIDDLEGVFDGDHAALREARDLVPHLERSPEAQRQFVDRVRSLLPPPSDPLEDGSDIFFATPGDDLLKLLEAPFDLAGPSPGGGGAADVPGMIGLPEGPPPDLGGAAGLGDFFSGIKAAARRLLNFATYYQMKERAGRVGAGGVHDLLEKIRASRPGQCVHLVGHSFGGRLVTAAAMGPPGSPSTRPSSMTLLQAAFSHNGFAVDFKDDKDGFFREVVTLGKIDGPILITHTKNDSAVGRAYPIASRIARQTSSDLGDEDDIYGGIGRNGALARFTPEAVKGRLLAVGDTYELTRGKLHNLEASAFIPDHGTVWKHEAAYAILSAMAA